MANAKVQRKVEDVFFAKALARESLASVGSGRQQHAMLGKAAPHLLDESADGKDFAEGNGVHPDDGLRLRRRAQARGNSAHAFDKSGAVFAAAKDLVEPVRQAQQHGQRQRETVEKIAQAVPF